MRFSFHTSAQCPARKAALRHATRYGSGSGNSNIAGANRFLTDLEKVGPSVAEMPQPIGTITQLPRAKWFSPPKAAKQTLVYVMVRFCH